MAAAQVDVGSVDAVVDYWLGELFPGVATAADRALAVDFLSVDDQGVVSALDPLDPEYEARIQKLLCFFMNFPQHLKQ